MAGKTALSRGSDPTGGGAGGYWYGTGSPVPFSAHIIDSLGSITGTTLEPNTFAHPGLIELSADIAGTRGELSVRFNKLYHPAPGAHREPIFYAGTVDSNFTMIDGDWRLSNGFSGRFVLVRVSRGAKAAEVTRSAELEVRR